MDKRVLLVQPPIYDFSAYDFWFKPYGLLRVGGMLRGKADLHVFDYLDRLHPDAPLNLRRDAWGCGAWTVEEIEKPRVFRTIPRRYKRFGLPRDLFRRFLAKSRPFDAVLISGGMTYWYPGVEEVLEDIRSCMPHCAAVIGGVYPQICPEHARSLGADLVNSGPSLEPLWDLLGVRGEDEQTPLWEAYPALESGVFKLTNGCPFQCTYCAVHRHGRGFSARPLAAAVAEAQKLQELGVRCAAFYDDALLAEAERILFPFLSALRGAGLRFAFHTPNALHARMINREIAGLLAESGFEKIYLGLESLSGSWLRQTGAKAVPDHFRAAVECLKLAGFRPSRITAYLMLGHPQIELQDLEKSLRAAHSLGVRIMLSEFSPLPGTPDGECCRKWVDLDEPLNHNKTAFPIIALGADRVQRLKNLAQQLNGAL